MEAAQYGWHVSAKPAPQQRPRLLQHDAPGIAPASGCKFGFIGSRRATSESHSSGTVENTQMLKCERLVKRGISCVVANVHLRS